jgi:hypothetical protein
MQTRKGWGQAKFAITLLFLAELKISSSQPRVRGRSPSSPQPSLHAPRDEAIEGGVRLHTLWLGSQGCIPVEEALAEIPPGQDGPRRQPTDLPTRLSLRGYREPVSHDAPITSNCSNIGRVSLQEPHGIGGPIVTHTDVWLEARRLGRAVKGPSERRKDPETKVANLWLTDLPNGLQAIEDLKTCLVMARVDGAKAKTVMTIVTHVEADLENTPQPPTWRTKCQWILCHKNMGYHAMDPKIRTQGAERGRSLIAMKHGDESLETSNAQRTTERDTELYPGSGPLW